MKILSVIIPAYNSEPYLDKCLSSLLLDEVLEALEVIVVNDGSTDRTAEIAEGYVCRYPDTVRLISQENKGHGGALNTGCAAARGRYLKVIDADDWVKSENLSAFLSLLADCESDVVLTHHETIDIGCGEIKKWRSYPKEFGRAYAFDEIMADWKSFDRSLTFHGITYRTAFYQGCGVSLSEHVFYEDHEYATLPCVHAATVTPFDLFIYCYRIGDVTQSVSNENQLRRLSHTETVLCRLMHEWKELPTSLTEGARGFYAMKVQGLLLSYLMTVLLVEKKKKVGRQVAAAMMAKVKAVLPETYGLALSQYRVFRTMNRLHIGKKTWDGIAGSKLYRILRGNHDFQ